MEHYYNTPWGPVWFNSSVDVRIKPSGRADARSPKAKIFEAELRAAVLRRKQEYLDEQRRRQGYFNG